MEEKLPGVDPEALFASILDADPTKPKSYCLWILVQVAYGKIRLPEDIPNVLEILTIFSAVKIRGSWKGQKDIYKWSSFGTLSEEMLAVRGTKSKRQVEISTKHEGTRKIYEDEEYMVIEANRKLGSLDAAKVQSAIWNRDMKTDIHVSAAALAVAAYAKETRWCVSDPATAEGYLTRGSLYVILRRSPVDGVWQQYLLADHGWSQIRNANDLMLTGPSQSLDMFLSYFVDTEGLPSAVVDKINHFRKRCMSTYPGRRVIPS